MYGIPFTHPKGAIVLRSHWQYHIKQCGTRRAWQCCDSSKKAAPMLHALAFTYSSCVEHAIQRLFFAIAADQNLRIYGEDIKDAYAHLPRPEIPTYVSIDNQYSDWYTYRYDKPIDRRKVLPVLKALQGHPEARRCWEAHINGILTELSFKLTTHNKTIYTKVHNGETVYMLRQVDNFALAYHDEVCHGKRALQDD